MHQKQRKAGIVLLLCFSLLLMFGSSFAPTVNGVQQQSSASAPSWVFVGAYLNYSVNANLGFGMNLGNGTMAFSGNVTGSVKAEVLSISGGNANVTAIPNINLKYKTTYPNGTVSTTAQTYGVSNQSSFLIPLGETNFGDVLQKELNSTSSLYAFSPSLNTSLSVNPAEVYQFNSTTKVIALHFHSSLYDKAAISPSLAISGSYSLNGTFDSYTTVAQDIPLEESLNLKGSALFLGVPGLIQSVSTQGQSSTAEGNLSFTLTLTSTNINLSSGGTDQQSVIMVPSYKTELDVVSNSTISGASTSGNKLIVNVTGPSGTAGVLDVVVSPALLNQAGVTAVGVILDGQTYTNYTVVPLGGSYLFTVYYHHSSHSIDFTFPNANLGSNVGTVSSLSTSGSTSLAPTTMLAVGAVVAIVVIALVIGFMRRGKKAAFSAPGTVASPAQML